MALLAFAVVVWGDEDDEDEGRRSRRFALLMERLTQGGNTVTLAVQPRDPVAGAIDVTPIEGRGGGE